MTTTTWKRAGEERLTRMEQKAIRKARKAGVEKASIQVHGLKDKMALEARGWGYIGSSSVGIATVSRHFLEKVL